MTEFTVRRIAVACDAACDIRLAVEAAVTLAGRWNAALHGVFLEDENLHRLAALPFGRQVTLSPAVSESFNSPDLDKLSSALGAAMRRTIAEAAAQRGLEWSFGIVRDLPTVAALAGIEADILIVEGATRPFSGSWRPRSAWETLAEEYARTTLIRRGTRAGPGTILILLSKHVDHQKALASGLAMAGPEDEIAILVRGGAESDVQSAKLNAERLGAARWRRVSIKAAKDAAALMRHIARLKPALIVLEPDDAGGHSVRDMLAGTLCDVLLVR